MQNLIASVLAGALLVSACGKGGDGTARSDEKDGGVEPPPSDVPAAVESAVATFEGIEGNGLKAEKMSCNGSGNALTLMANVGGLSTQKGALQACVSKPTKPRVQWTVRAKKTTDVRVAEAGDATTARCIADAIEKVETDIEGTCVATLVLGAQ